MELALLHLFKRPAFELRWETLSASFNGDEDHATFCRLHDTFKPLECAVLDPNTLAI